MSRTERDQVREQLGRLLQRRRKIEDDLLVPRSYLHASLLERFLGSRDRQRKSPAYYLSRSIRGKSHLKHVRKQDLDRVRREVEAYRTFSEKLVELRRLCDEILAAFLRFVRVQEDPDYAFHDEEEGEASDSG